MFQTSWDIHGCSGEIQKLLDVWSPGNQPQCYRNIFAKEVSCSQSDWSSYGSGNGKKHQDMSKSCPPYHAEMTAVGLRKRRQHWGPINRYEVEIKTDADIMFQEVQDYVDTMDATEPPVPVPGVAAVRIETEGDVEVWVNGARVA